MFGYYLFDNKQHIPAIKGCKIFKDDKARIAAKNLFEDQQEQLEMNVERLAYDMERPVEKLCFDSKLKDEILSLTLLCKKRREGLIDTILRELMI